MKQVYHANAKTNLHSRNQICNSQLPVNLLAENHQVSQKTIRKWKSRDDLTDKSSRPNNIKYALSELDMLIAIELRLLTWWSVEQIAEAINKEAPLSIRSAVYRTFVREGINTAPQKEKEKAKKFKEYDPGYLHIDVTYLPKINGIKYYLFVAIDRATRTIYFKIYDAKTSENAEHFLKECIDFFPIYITHILTDNGLEFTNRLLVSKKGKACQKPSKFDVVCQENDIDHRCTKPFTPQTNGMVEKANDTIKKETVKKTNYNSLEEMYEDLMRFLVHYNLYRRHGSLRRELNVKTPFDAVEKWHQLDPKIFKENPKHFEQKILSLKPVKTSCHEEQRCET